MTAVITVTYTLSQIQLIQQWVQLTYYAVYVNKTGGIAPAFETPIQTGTQRSSHYKIYRNNTLGFAVK